MTRRSAFREVGGPHPGKDGMHPGGLHLEVCVWGGLHLGVGGALRPWGGWTDSPQDIWDTIGCGQHAGSTHPTRIHSC